MTQRPTLIVVNVLLRSYRGYLLRSLAERYAVWLFAEQPPTWELRYIVGHTLLDTRDAVAMARAAAELAPAGILTWDETRLDTVADAAAALGLRDGPPGAVRRCRDKHETRRALDRAGVPQARSLAVATPDDAMRAAAVIGFPVVVKPRALSGSYGVTRVDAIDAVPGAFAHARASGIPGVPALVDGVLVEEYLDGPEVSVDSVVAGGVVTPLYVARKRLGFPPYFEETGHVVDASDPLLGDPALRDVVEGAHRAVGLRDAWTHAELRLTASGPKVVELNARLGGDAIPYLGLLATGVDPGLAAAAAATGATPETTPTRRRCAGVRFCYPDADVVVGDVAVDRSALDAIASGVASDVEVEVLARPGDRLRLPPHGHISGRAAFVIATADSRDACERALDAAAAAVTVTAAELAGRA